MIFLIIIFSVIKDFLALDTEAVFDCLPVSVLYDHQNGHAASFSPSGFHTTVCVSLLFLSIFGSSIYHLANVDNVSQKHHLKCRPETKNSSKRSAFRARSIMALRIRKFR
ncbi:hypothetical protein NECAME_06623 [Necator americanus]|uniref:Uncharacterized protein n=1 Tax=Necator americanus TaxID=51031 RepID=W2TTB1_NECAM|nr:hypothetical protein NECAME_06623 [Necator americanus]ETN84899.1 hypothetical protein NECAME_06623 [Necator americanus]